MGTAAQRLSDRMETVDDGMEELGTRPAQRVTPPRRRSDRHQVLFLGLQRLVDHPDVVVVELLHLVEAAALVVLADLLSFSSFLSASLPSRRAWRMPLRRVSAKSWAFLTISLRRSSVSDGTGMRITLPSLDGLSPRSAWRMARSIAAIWSGIPGLRHDQRGVGHVRFATWLSGVGVPK